MKGKKWHILNYLTIKQKKIKGRIRISTIELPTIGYTPYIFETMIFSEDNSLNFTNHFLTRYKTKAQAVKVHKRIVNKLKKGQFELIPTYYELKIKGVEG